MSLPRAPSAMPTAPALSASESSMPSPITNGRLPAETSARTPVELVLRQRLRLDIVDADERRDAPRHRFTIAGEQELARKTERLGSALAEAASGRGSSARRIQPRKRPASATPTTGPSCDGGAGAAMPSE